jgi:hypothetical protein
MDHETTEKMSRMSMINLPIIPACFIISKIDKSTTFLLVDVNLALIPTTSGKKSPCTCCNAAKTSPQKHKTQPALQLMICRLRQDLQAGQKRGGATLGLPSMQGADRLEKSITITSNHIRNQ